MRDVNLLLVDPRLGSKDLIEPLRMMGLDVDPVQIDADIAFEGRGIGGTPVTIGVEFKKLGELVQALQTERLQGHQLLQMQAAFEFKWLLVEGEIITDAQGFLSRRIGKRKFVRLPGGMTLDSLWKRLLTLQICGGLTPVLVETRVHTLHFVETLYHFWTDKNQDEHKSHIAIYEPPTLVPPSQFRRTIFTLPGIGQDLARKAESRFGSLREAFNASEVGWADIEGVGMRTAHKVVEAITKTTR